jgi:hypothetical protein
MIFISMKVIAALASLMLLSSAWFIWTVANAPSWEEEDV